MLLSLDRDNGDEHDGTDATVIIETAASKDTINVATEDEDQDAHIADSISAVTNFSEGSIRST